MGAEEKPDDTLITPDEILLILLLSTEPSGRITERVGLLDVVNPVASSTVIAVVVALLIRPDLL